MQRNAAKTVLFLSNHFITLYNFRRELIERLVRRGHRVVLSMPADEKNRYFTELGCELIETPMSRRGMNPVEDMKLIERYKKIIAEVRPDIIFSYTIKPNIYGTMASNSLGYRQVCNITGTGATFMKNGPIPALVRALYRASVAKCYKVFFQNTGDRDYFIRHKMVRDNYAMLPGSGVNLAQYSCTELPRSGTDTFIFIGRVMKVKGVEQFLDCAKAVKEKHPDTRFLIAGFIEQDEYKSVIDEAVNRGEIEYLGFCSDISERIKDCTCTILPSLGGEGVPNVLLETAASGRVCIASDINGSRDVIDDGVTGYLYEVGSSASLISKVEEFLSLSYEQKRDMGLAGRRKVEREYDREIVIDRYISEAEG